MRKLLDAFWKAKNNLLCVFSLSAIMIHLFLRFVLKTTPFFIELPLWVAFFVGGVPLVFKIFRDFLKGNWGSDLLAGTAIVISFLMGEYLAGAIVITMLSGGAALENYAVQNASSVLQALAKRTPSVAHRRKNSTLEEIAVSAILPGDTLVVFPHEICPVDGVVLEGYGTMDEAYLTGEPFQIDKAPGTAVISGAINGQAPLTITAAKRAMDSRYEQIMEVMRTSEKNKPQIRRLADRLGAFYTPIAFCMAGLAWFLSGDTDRFLAVLVIATPCPLLIGIPVVVLGSISLAAKRAIIIKNATLLEQIDRCQIAIFDKTGTLTTGEPQLSEIICLPGYNEEEVLSLAASIERYSKHPLAHAILTAAEKRLVALHAVKEVREIPGKGLHGIVLSKQIQVAGRAQFTVSPSSWPATQEGLECLLAIDDHPAAVFRFHDTLRPEGLPFIRHLGPQHQLERTILLSGDRESEVRYFAEKIGITEIYAGKSPEEKLAFVKAETLKARTLFVGDGINDAPALMAATVGVAIGRGSDITSSAAGAVIMDSSLAKVDELIHIGRRMRVIALQSAIGGMILSLAGMLFAAAGYLPPVWGAIAQEVIDLLAILNALRAAFPTNKLSDF